MVRTGGGQVLTEILGNKVDKVDGKGLSTNDYSTAEKTKLAELSNYDDSEINNKINNKRMLDVRVIGIRTTSEKQRIGITTNCAVPLNYTLVKVGVLYQNTFNKDTNGNLIEPLLNISSNSTDIDGVYIKGGERNITDISIKKYEYVTYFADSSDDHVLAMPYVVVKDGHDVEHMIKGEIYTLSYTDYKDYLDQSIKETDTIKEIYDMIHNLQNGTST